MSRLWTVYQNMDVTCWDIWWRVEEMARTNHNNVMKFSPQRQQRPRPNHAIPQAFATQRPAPGFVGGALACSLLARRCGEETLGFGTE
jgi:hypothetical protein